MPAQAAARQSMEPEPRVSIVLAPPKGLELLNEDSTGFMIAPLRTALHVHGWNLAALLSGQGHGKDSKLQPGGCENQDEEEGPAPPHHGGPQQEQNQKRPRGPSPKGWAHAVRTGTVLRRTRHEWRS